MPVTFSSSKKGSTERTLNLLMDWARRIMQLSMGAVIILYAYLLYGLFMGDIGHWALLKNVADQARLVHNVETAIQYLNIALGILLACVCLLYYDEEILGYVLVGASVGLYFGLPFLIEMAFQGQLADWGTTKNVGAFAIYNQFKTLALMLAVVGGILAVRDLILRFADGSSRKKEDFRAMQFGGKVEEEEAPSNSILGAFAKCWQLPFCRPAIRKNCPIFLAKTKCWKERVGCMCEESVVRHSMDVIISKEPINFNKPESSADDLIKMDGDLGPSLATATTIDEKTQPVKVHVPKAHVRPKDVKIPHNPHLSNAIKAERCRNCTIYNEHQRKKYQLLAPLFVLGIPLVVILKIDVVTVLLSKALSAVDKIMANISLVQSNGSGGGAASNALGSSGAIQYMVIGCLVIIFATMALRFLEFLVFKLKI